MPSRAEPITLDEYLADRELQSRTLFESARTAVESIGPSRMRVTKSQVAFRRRDDSPRWKRVVESQPGRFTHHLELRSPQQLDDEVGAWLREAWEASA